MLIATLACNSPTLRLVCREYNKIRGGRFVLDQNDRDDDPSSGYNRDRPRIETDSLRRAP